MKRDMELIRKIMLRAESGDGGVCPPIQIDGYTTTQIGYHCYLIAKMGLAEGSDAEMSATGPNWGLSFLTPEGHDFIDAIRDDTVWQGHGDW